MKRGEWIDRDGQLWKIKNMTTQHITDSLQFLQDQVTWMDNKRQELSDEYFRRQKKYEDGVDEVTQNDVEKLLMTLLNSRSRYKTYTELWRDRFKKNA